MVILLNQSLYLAFTPCFLREQPGKQFWLSVSSVPGVMADPRIFGVTGSAAGLFQHFDHRPATNNRNYRIFRAMKRPYRNMPYPVSEVHIPSSADRDASREI